MKNIPLFIAFFILLFQPNCYSQNGIEATVLMLDMMYMCPYNYNSNGALLKNNKVKTISFEYAGYQVTMNVNPDGLRESAVLDTLASMYFKYYDDGRMSDLAFSVNGYDNVRTTMLFTYGAPYADFDAVFLFPSNVGSDQKAAFFCDNNGRVLRMSLAVQRLETVKCEFSYSSDRIVKIDYRETGPEYFYKLSITAAYTYGKDGLIDTETLMLPGEKEIVVNYKYTFYE